MTAKASVLVVNHLSIGMLTHPRRARGVIGLFINGNNIEWVRPDMHLAYLGIQNYLASKKLMTQPPAQS